MTHAMIAVFNHPRETWERQKPFLHERIIPMVKAQPGFIEGRWSYDPVTSKTYSHVTWRTEEEAKAFALQLREQKPPPGVPDLGVRLDSIVVAEVLGEASA